MPHIIRPNTQLFTLRAIVNIQNVGDSLNPISCPYVHCKDGLFKYNYISGTRECTFSCRQRNYSAFFLLHCAKTRVREAMSFNNTFV